MKELELTIHITKDGEHLATERRTVSVPSDEFYTLFAALREQHPELYSEYPDAKFEITNVEAV